MRKNIPLAVLALLALLPFSTLAQQPAAPPAPSVKVGQAAPDFTLQYLAPEDGGKFAEKKLSLSDFKGKGTVILAFFPAAFSPGWIIELSRYRDEAAKLGDVNAQVVGVSVDSVWANKAFAEKLNLRYPLLSDWKHDVARKYGVYDEANGVARRTTFVIDENGIVRHVDQSREALDPSGAIGACPIPRKK